MVCLLQECGVHGVWDGHTEATLGRHEPNGCDIRHRLKQTRATTAGQVHGGGTPLCQPLSHQVSILTVDVDMKCIIEAMILILSLTNTVIMLISLFQLHFIKVLLGKVNFLQCPKLLFIIIFFDPQAIKCISFLIKLANQFVQYFPLPVILFDIIGHHHVTVACQYGDLLGLFVLHLVAFTCIWGNFLS